MHTSTDFSCWVQSSPKYSDYGLPDYGSQVNACGSAKTSTERDLAVSWAFKQSFDVGSNYSNTSNMESSDNYSYLGEAIIKTVK